jgi:superfamily II DNA/RNA helicase
VDIVVGSPGRMVQHKEQVQRFIVLTNLSTKKVSPVVAGSQGNVYLRHVRYIVIDEVDTMLMQGFGEDVRCISCSMLYLPPSVVAAP